MGHAESTDAAHVGKHASCFPPHSHSFEQVMFSQPQALGMQHAQPMPPPVVAVSSLCLQKGCLKGDIQTNRRYLHF